MNSLTILMTFIHVWLLQPNLRCSRRYTGGVNKHVLEILKHGHPLTNQLIRTHYTALQCSRYPNTYIGTHHSIRGTIKPTHTPTEQPTTSLMLYWDVAQTRLCCFRFVHSRWPEAQSFTQLMKWLVVPLCTHRPKQRSNLQPLWSWEMSGIQDLHPIFLRWPPKMRVHILSHTSWVNSGLCCQWSS